MEEVSNFDNKEMYIEHLIKQIENNNNEINEKNLIITSLKEEKELLIEQIKEKTFIIELLNDIRNKNFVIDSLKKEKTHNNNFYRPSFNNRTSFGNFDNKSIFGKSSNTDSNFGKSSKFGNFGNGSNFGKSSNTGVTSDKLNYENDKFIMKSFGGNKYNLGNLVACNENSQKLNQNNYDDFNSSNDSIKTLNF
jgi:hypothetical protein